MTEPAPISADPPAPSSPSLEPSPPGTGDSPPSPSATGPSTWRLLRTILRDIATVDPRTLGFFRITLSLVLIGDLIKRSASMHEWYFQGGLLPIATQVAEAQRVGFYSIFWHLSSDAAVVAGFVAIFVSYLGLLVGYRTKLFQVLALAGLVSLHARVSWLCNGGDFVLCSLLWWTLFLPLGKRFSIDAWRRGPADPNEKVVSVAMVVALVQLATIYFFNAVHKRGVTWRDGTAIHYVLWQERIITSVGLWARHHLPFAFTRVLTHLVLWLEYLIPFLLLSPVAKTFCRRAAIVVILLLHGGISLFGNYGMFSWAMCLFAMLLWTSDDWDAVERWLDRRSPALSTRIFTTEGTRDTEGITERKFSSSVSRVCSVVNSFFRGFSYSSRFMGWSRRAGQLAILLPLALAIPQVFVENRVIPKALRIEQPPSWFNRLVWATRLRQGWNMFAPDAPRREMTVVVDAQTEDGRAVDPVYEAAMGDGTPRLDGVPVGAGMNVYWVDFLSHVPHNEGLRQGLSDWLRDYHLRTGRAGDRLVRFAAYHVSRASPAPGETEPSDVKRTLLFRGAGARPR